MYKEVQCYYFNNVAYQQESFNNIVENRKAPKVSDYYTKGSTKIINLNEIRTLEPTKISDTVTYYSLVLVGDTYQDRIIVSEADGDEIKRILLSNRQKGNNNLDKTLDTLVTAIRDLTNILRCRLH